MSSKETKMLQKLGELEQKEGGLPSFVQLYRELLRIQSKARGRLTAAKPKLADDVISTRLSQGIPLLTFDGLLLDWSQVRSLLQEIVQFVAQAYPDIPDEVNALSNILSEETVLEEVVKTWYEGSPLAPFAAGHGINIEILELVVAATVKPFLSAQSEVLLPKVGQEAWRRRYCPICGGKPDFAYLEKEVGARWLICSRCDAEWLFQRLECPCCGCQDQNALAYFTDDKGLYRLYVCEQCKGYVKAVDLRQAEPEVLLPLERLLTFEIDIQAHDDGYKSCLEVDAS